MTFKNLIGLSCAFLLTASSQAWCSDNKKEKIETIKFQSEEGCKDAINASKYDQMNLRSTFGKLIRTHRYNSKKDDISSLGNNVYFDYSVVGDFNNLLNYISNNCEYDSHSSLDTTSSSCYFKCRENIGLHHDGNSHNMTNRIQLIYKLDNKKVVDYYLLSLYPAVPEKN